MHYELARWAEGITFSGNVRTDAVTFLRHHGNPLTAGHSARVAAEAERIATRFDADSTAAGVAGWLHDISAVVPNGDRIALAEALAIPVLPEERTLPMIIHQKLSTAFAHDLFGVNDGSILSAIGCHTTLKAGASLLDKVVFVADKVAWDQPGDPPYLDAIMTALARSLDDAAFCYINFLWQRRESLAVVHPWLVEAYNQYC